MGFFWDLLQQYQLGQSSARTGSLEERIEDLERDQQAAQQAIEQMAKRLDEIDPTFTAEDLNNE